MHCAKHLLVLYPHQRLMVATRLDSVAGAPQRKVGHKSIVDPTSGTSAITVLAVTSATRILISISIHTGASEQSVSETTMGKVHENEARVLIQ